MGVRVCYETLTKQLYTVYIVLCWYLPAGPARSDHEADLASLGSDPGAVPVSCHGLHRPQRPGERASPSCYEFRVSHVASNPAHAD